MKKTTISEWCEQVQLELVEHFRAVVIGVFTDVVQRTPVDTGRLRASWRIGIGSPDRSCEPPGTYSPDAAMRQLSKLRGLKSDNLDVYISNSVEYASIIEHGTSKQAPAGMVATTVASWKSHGAVGFKVSRA